MILLCIGGVVTQSALAYLNLESLVPVSEKSRNLSVIMLLPNAVMVGLASLLLPPRGVTGASLTARFLPLTFILALIMVTYLLEMMMKMGL